MGSAVGNQTDLSAMHKQPAKEAKAAYRKGGKWEKEEVSQPFQPHINTYYRKTNVFKTRKAFTRNESVF